MRHSMFCVSLILVPVLFLSASVGSQEETASRKAESARHIGESGPVSPEQKLTAVLAELPADELFQRISPAVGKIIVKDDCHNPFASGSGFFLSSEWVYSRDSEAKKRDDAIAARGARNGYLLTNYHVIMAAVEADVELSDGRRGSVWRVIDEDEASDLALLAVSVKSQQPLKTLDLRAGQPPKIGTKVYAIGSPEGLTNTLSEGIISGLRAPDNGEPSIQTTAAISAGSSGGPLLTLDGKVIGVTTYRYIRGQNLNFAVPASVLQDFLKSPLNPRELWRGVSVRKEEEEAYNLARLVKSLRDSTKKKDDEKPETADQLALLLRARRCFTERNYSDAIKAANLAGKAKRGKFAYLVYYTLGWAQYLAHPHEPPRGFQVAIPAFKKATELNPDFAPAFDSLSQCYSLSRLYPEALVAAEFLAKLVPRCSGAYYRRADAYSGLGRYAAAVRDYHKAIELRPNN